MRVQFESIVNSDNKSIEFGKDYKLPQYLVNFRTDYILHRLLPDYIDKKVSDLVTDK